MCIKKSLTVGVVLMLVSLALGQQYRVLPDNYLDVDNQWQYQSRRTEIDGDQRVDLWGTETWENTGTENVLGYDTTIQQITTVIPGEPNEVDVDYLSFVSDYLTAIKNTWEEDCGIATEIMRGDDPMEYIPVFVDTAYDDYPFGHGLYEGSACDWSDWTGDTDAEITFLRTETITVPAGTFECVVVDLYSEWHDDGDGWWGHENLTIWLHPDIGMVRRVGYEWEWDADASRAYEEEGTIELLWSNLLPGGSITGWGSNDRSPHNEPIVYYNQATPQDGDDYIAIAAGMWHSIALKSDGTIFAWGADDNEFDETTNQVNDTPDGNDFTAIAAGYYHSVAIKSDFSLATWGDDFYGQATAPSGNDFIAVAAGMHHSLALTSGGNLVAWGIHNGGPNYDPDDDEGQVTDKPTDSGYIAIAAGKKFNIAIQSAGVDPNSGMIVGWGKDFYNSLTNIPDGNDFVAVAAGVSHGLALKSDGTLEAWGGSLVDYGQTTVPAGSDFVAIAAGEYHNVAMKEDGTIVAWGRDNKDQKTDTPSGNNFIAIAAGGYHCLAIEAEDTNPIAPDFNGDNMTDLLWRQTSTGKQIIQLMNGLNKGQSNVLGANQDWPIVGLGDFNGDGMTDLLWRQTSTGKQVIQLMNGLNKGQSNVLDANQDWPIVGLGDFNGDGMTDLLWRQTSTGKQVIQLMNGLNKGQSNVLGANQDWPIVGLGDFNGDGMTDLLWRQTSTGKQVIQLMNGLNKGQSNVLGANQDWPIVGLGDFNGDGMADLLWRQTSTGKQVIQLMNGLNKGQSNVLGANQDWPIVFPASGMCE